MAHVRIKFSTDQLRIVDRHVIPLPGRHRHFSRATRPICPSTSLCPSSGVGFFVQGIKVSAATAPGGAGWEGTSGGVAKMAVWSWLKLVFTNGCMGGSALRWGRVPLKPGRKVRDGSCAGAGGGSRKTLKTF